MAYADGYLETMPLGATSRLLGVDANGLVILDDRLDSDPLIDEVGARTLTDATYTLGNFASSTATVTIPEITDQYPSGSVIELLHDVTYAAAGNFIFDAGPSRQNEYAQASVYLYDPSGNFSGISVTFYLRNGTTNTVLGGADTVQVTQVSTHVRRYDLHAQFTASWANYGITAAAYRTQNTGPVGQSLYFFGFMAACTAARRLSQKLQPTAWVAKSGVARGYTAQVAVPVDTNWVNKKIVWMGSSIPEGGGYPEAVASELGAASIANIAYGGGAIRAFNENGTPFAQASLIYKFSLEIADVNALYQANVGSEVSATNYATLQPGSGFTLTQAHINALVAQNWVARLQPHIATGDLFVFDYGINDRGGQTTFPFQTPAVAGYDRKHFAGAMNYIFKQIYDARKALGLNTRAAFITHHNRVSTNTTDVVDAQIAIAKYWGAPVINIADNCGVNSLTLTDLIPDTLHFALNSEIELRVRHQIVEALKAAQP